MVIPPGFLTFRSSWENMNPYNNEEASWTIEAAQWLNPPMERTPPAVALP
jgi:hypothetical protein